MADYSAGKKLSTARLERGMTIDEAAHAVKMRPDKIVALENDDFSRFGSPAYARGFLMIYGRFLGVDVSPHLQEFENANMRVNLEEYQYLNNAPEPVKEERMMPNYGQDRRRAPSVWPLVVFMGISAVAALGYWIKVQSRRLDESSPVGPTPTALLEKATPVPSRAVSSTPVATPVPDRTVPGAASPSNIAATGTPVTSPEPVVPRPLPINELIVNPVKKAWVKIREGTPDSAPIFEGDLYPGVGALKLKGTRFYVEVRDQSSVQIRNNGMPIAYQAPGITIP